MPSTRSHSPRLGLWVRILAACALLAVVADAALASAVETLDAEASRRPRTDLRSAAAFSIVPSPREEHPFFDRTRRFVYRGLLGTHPVTEARIDRLRSCSRALETDSGEPTAP